MAPRRKRGSAQSCDVVEPPTKMFGLGKEHVLVANVLDGPTLQRFFVSSPRGPSRGEATIQSTTSNDAAPSMCSASVVSMDDDRGSIDLDRDAAGAEFQGEAAKATPSTPPNTPLGLTKAPMVAAHATAEPEVVDKQGGATAADVVTAVMQGKLDGIVNGVLSGEPLSEKNYDKYMQFLLNTTAVGVEGRPDGDVTEAHHGTKDKPLTKKEEQRERAMRQIIEAGEFPARSSMANLFRASLAPGSGFALAYASCDSTKQQHDFRLNWCKEQHAALAHRRSLSRDVQLSKTDISRFRYRPFGSMVVEWGGWGCSDAIKGAMSASAMCCSLGRPWAKIHPQSGLLEFAILDQSWEEVFKESWREHVDVVLNNAEVSKANDVEGGDATVERAPIGDGAASATPATDPAAAIAATIECADPVQAIPAPAPLAVAPSHSKRPVKPKAKAAGSAGSTKGRVRDAAIGDGEDGNLQRLLKESARIKQDFLRTVSAAEELRKVIVAGGDFRWAQDNVQGDKKLAAHTAALRHGLTDWSQNYLLSESGAIRKNFTEARIITELTTFVGLAPHVAQLGKTVKQIMAATAAMQAE